VCRLLSGFSAKKSVVQSSKLITAGRVSSIAAARLLSWILVGAFYGGPPLVSGCCGSPLGGGPPDFWKDPGLPAVIGWGLAGRRGFRPARGLIQPVRPQRVCRCR
jgi:hypothetical protein